MKLNTKVMIIGGAGLAVVLLLMIKKKDGQSLAAAAGAAVGTAAVDAATGVVVGIGEAIGITPTSETECEKAMREGRTWDASFACDATTFIKYLASSTPPTFGSSATPAPTTPTAPGAVNPHDAYYTDAVSSNDSGINFNLF